MLLKRDVSELRKFINNHPHSYGKEFIKAINQASDQVLEISLHKMIVHAVRLPEKFRQESADWLIEHGFDLNIGYDKEETK